MLPCILLALDQRPDTAKVVVGGQVEGEAVIAEAVVGDPSAGIDPSEQLALGGNDQGTPRRGDPEVAACINRKAVGRAPVSGGHQLLCREQQFLAAEGTIFLDRIAPPFFLLCQIEVFFIG